MELQQCNNCKKQKEKLLFKVHCHPSVFSVEAIKHIFNPLSNSSFEFHFCSAKCLRNYNW